MILPEACCANCEREVGSRLEGSLTHKTKGMFAALRLRHDYKSKRPKDRPASLPYTVVGVGGTRRIIHIPAKKVPRHWVTFITGDPPGIFMGRTPIDPAPVAVYAQHVPEDFAEFVKSGERS